MTYEQFIRNTGYWNEKHYSDGFPNLVTLNENLKVKTIECLREMGILSTEMNGDSIRGLPHDNPAERLGAINYSELFHDMTENNSFFSPTYFAYRIVEKYCDSTEEYNSYIAQGYICRGLRTLASMFREMCLEYKVKTRLPEATITVGAEQDINEHTDIMIGYNENVFRIWSYQSNRLNNTVEKIKGNRGELPSGLYILCPLNINERESIEDINGWYMYSDGYIDRIIEVLQQDEFNNADNYINVISTRSNYEIEAYIRQIRFFVKED